MSNNQRPKLMGKGDASKYLWVTNQYVDQLARAWKIPYQKVSMWMVFFEEDIINFAKDRIERAKTNPKIKINRN